MKKREVENLVSLSLISMMNPPPPTAAGRALPIRLD
jgi:hypothetical protein